MESDGSTIQSSRKKVGLWFPLSCAIVIDGLQAGIDLLHFIPVIGNFFAAFVTGALTLFAFLGFYIYFKGKGINFSSPKRLLGFGGSALIEFIPVINALPAWTVAVLITVSSANTETA